MPQEIQDHPLDLQFSSQDSGQYDVVYDKQN